MSNTNEKKIRNIDRKLANLKQEKKYYSEMINNIKKENFYLRNQRNKKIMVNITKSVLPYVISFEIIVFSVKINGYGYPIIQDKIKNYKSYCFDMDYDKTSKIEESYTSIMSDEENYISIYSPWEVKNDYYVRTKKTIKMEEVDKNLFEAMINKNYDYVFNKVNVDTQYDVLEETQMRNLVFDGEDNDYKIECHLNYNDYDSIAYIKESTTENIVVTLIEAFLAFSIGMVVASVRDENYMKLVYDAIDEYNKKKLSYEQYEKKLDKVKIRTKKLNNERHRYEK